MPYNVQKLALLNFSGTRAPPSLAVTLLELCGLRLGRLFCHLACDVRLCLALYEPMPQGDTVHYIHPKISIPVFIVLAVLVISQPSLATTLSLDVTTLKGVEQIGSVTTTQVGKDVKVTIALDPGYLLPTEDSYVMFNTGGGLKLTRTSLEGFSASKMSDKLSHMTTIGGFTFTDIFRIDTQKDHEKVGKTSSRHHDHDKDDQVADNDDDHAQPKAAHRHHDHERDEENRILLSDLTFTILNANVNQLTGFGLQFCVADEGRCGKTGFAETSRVPVAAEPSTLALIGTGLVGLATMVRRRSSGRKK